jgi:hypothetical protein
VPGLPWLFNVCSDDGGDDDEMDWTWAWKRGRQVLPELLHETVLVEENIFQAAVGIRRYNKS